MAELSTLARPYAKAAFEYARAGGTLTDWSRQLSLASAIVADEGVSRVLGDPALTSEQQAQVLIDLCGDELGSEGCNYVHILAENKRLSLLPEIASLFDQLKAAAEKSVYTAFELAEGTEQKLAQVPTQKLEREVKVDTNVDKNLIGGVLIRAGDLVIDGSVRGRLDKLAEAMNS